MRGTRRRNEIYFGMITRTDMGMEKDLTHRLHERRKRYGTMGKGLKMMMISLEKERGMC